MGKWWHGLQFCKGSPIFIFQLNLKSIIGSGEGKFWKHIGEEKDNISVDERDTRRDNDTRSDKNKNTFRVFTPPLKQKTKNTVTSTENPSSTRG